MTNVGLKRNGYKFGEIQAVAKSPVGKRVCEKAGMHVAKETLVGTGGVCPVRYNREVMVV